MADFRFLPDLDALVAPLSGDAPGGDRRVFNAIADQVKKLRTEEDPSRYSPDDKMAPKEFKPADWAGVLRLCLPLLTEKAKDLRIAQYVVDALPRRHEADRERERWTPAAPAPAGFAALSEGLVLLRRMTADGWEYVLPAFDPEEPDPEARNGPFNWLGEDNEGAALPQFVRLLPLAVTANGVLNQQGWATAQGEERANLERVAAAADVDQLTAVLTDLTTCRADLTTLRETLVARLGDDAPGLMGLKAALDECHALVRGLIQQKTGGDPVAAAPTGGATAGGGPVVAGPPAPAATREAAYQQLRQAAELLRRLEPHSPVPFLVMRAVDLGNKPFPEMIKSFVRDDGVLAELRRDLNIPDAPAAD